MTLETYDLVVNTVLKIAVPFAFMFYVARQVGRHVSPIQQIADIANPKGPIYMRVHSVEIDERRTRAVVILRPSRWERMFGATDTKCELSRVRYDGSTPNTYSYSNWVSVNSNRELQELKYGSLIRNALEHAPAVVAELPKASVVDRG